jgi:hypothetical protein
MKTPIAIPVMIAALAVVGTVMMLAQPATPPLSAASAETKLAVVWTSGDPEVAHRVCLMYAHAATTQKWFDRVTLIVWGPSARLLAADKDVQAKIKSMMEDGVLVQACVVCADSYGVSERLRELGLEVKAMGLPLTRMLKDDWKVITF